MERVVQLRPYGVRFYKLKEYPHGLQCGKCGYLFTVRGEPIFEILTHRFPDGTPVVELVCMKCAKKQVA